MIVMNKGCEYSEVKDDDQFNSDDDTYRSSMDENDR